MFPCDKCAFILEIFIFRMCFHFRNVLSFSRCAFIFRMCFHFQDVRSFSKCWRNLFSTITSNVKFLSLVIAVTAGAWSIKCIEFASPFSPRKGLAASTSTNSTENGCCRNPSEAMDMSLFKRSFFSSSILGYWPRCWKLKLVFGFFWPLFTLGEGSDGFNSSATVSSPPKSQVLFQVFHFSRQKFAFASFKFFVKQSTQFLLNIFKFFYFGK